ncbi:MAG: LysR family transcriptional regulator [Hydrogenoanaerobacterium sp.]
MDIKHLEFFVAVAHYGSINKAAQALYISQPHLSHIIKDFEENVGFPLFKRTKQGVVLTTEGEQFLEHSSVILKELENLKNFSHKLHTCKDCLTVSMTKFSHTMESFNEVCANNEKKDSFSYRLNEGTTVEVIDDVASGVADVGVIHFASNEAQILMDSFKEKKISFKPIASMIPHICISKNHELIRQNKAATLASLKGYGFVRYFGQYEDFIYSIATKNIRLDLNNSPKIAYVYGRATLLHLIASSNFYTIGIKEFLTQNSMYNMLSIPIKNCSEHLEFGIITAEGAELSESANEFIENVTGRYAVLQKLDDES